jgi:uncharacterized protein (TIGR03435 family)
MKKLPWIACLAAAALIASGQAATNAPEFDVAAVKPVAAPDLGRLAMLPASVTEDRGFDGGPGSKDPGRINYHEVTLKSLLAKAYDVKSDQISGPSWLGSEHYTIQATLPPDTDKDRFRLMLQRLLAERFGIRLHREERQAPVYLLKVAKNGPKLKPAEEVPQYQSEDERKEAAQKAAQEGMAKMMEANARPGVKTGGQSIYMTRGTTQRFAEMLRSPLGRPVVDRTQLPGEYSLRLAWNPDNGPQDDSGGVSIFTAIQEQLGLTLEGGKEPIEFLVIDEAQKVPTAN